MSKSLPKNIGELKEHGWTSRSVKEEMRENLLDAIKNGGSFTEGIVGYEKTVLPQIENAILSKHNFILLGLRGQGKSRIIRQLYLLLDEFVPVLSGTLLNEDPLKPISPLGSKMIAENGDKTKIEWIGREARFHEKLATPDVSIADLIGDIDPIKAAREKLDISNEEVIHWGIIPRTNRGIFAINELPDLQPRIQVGLLNILEENDIQVRGFPLRVPLDMMLVFTANPEDYTNRGNIITPLKDRIDSQIVTHYPRSLREARAITATESDHPMKHEVILPDIMYELIEEVTFQARESEYVDQTSGVSARVSIAAHENLISNIERRVARSSDGEYYPRIADLLSIIPAVSGKIELVYEGEQEGATLVSQALISQAINQVFLRHFPQPVKGKQDMDQPERENPYEAITDYFSAGRKLELTDDMTTADYRQAILAIPGLKQIAERYYESKDEREILLVSELLLEALHHNNVIAREIRDSSLRYSDVLSDMLRGSGHSGGQR